MPRNKFIPIFSVFAAVLLAALVAACAAFPAPETPRQALAAAEIVFQGLVEQATVMKPKMSADQKKAVGAIIHEIDGVLEAARGVVDAPTLESKLILVQQGLRRLRLQLDKGGGPVRRSLGGGGK